MPVIAFVWAFLGDFDFLLHVNTSQLYYSVDSNQSAYYYKYIVKLHNIKIKGDETMENEIKELEDMTATEIVKEGLKKGVSDTAKKPWFKRLVALLLTFCIGFVFGFYQHRKAASPSGVRDASGPSTVLPTPTEMPSTITIIHVVDIISPASDLITTKYTYTDADTYEDYKEFFKLKLPFTTNEAVFTYSGECGIGFDLSKLSIYPDNENKTITIVFPEIEVKYNEIDAESFEYYSVTTTIFNQLKMEDTTSLIAILLEAKESEVLNSVKIMEESRKNAETVLKSLLSNSELTKDYKIIFK